MRLVSRGFTRKILILAALILSVMVVQTNRVRAGGTDYCTCIDGCNYDEWLCVVGCQAIADGEERAQCTDACWNQANACEWDCYQEWGHVCHY
jgi:hypothetical protein